MTGKVGALLIIPFIYSFFRLKPVRTRKVDFYLHGTTAFKHDTKSRPEINNQIFN